MPYDLGDTVRLQATCTDPGGSPVTAGTAVLTITLPDGTTTSPAVPAPSAPGQYTVDYPTAAQGRHAARWVFTDPASAYTDAFDVSPAVPALVLPLAPAKRHLALTDTTAYDDELREWLEGITEGVEHLCGAVARRTVTEIAEIPVHGVPTVALRTTPVLQITSTTPVLTTGWSWTPDELDVDGETGVVRRIDGGLLYGPLRWVYQAGRVSTPASLTGAAKMILQHLWRTKYGSSRALPGIGGGDDFAVTEPIPGFGYAIPNRALQMMEPHRLPPGMA